MSRDFQCSKFACSLIPASLIRFKRRLFYDPLNSYKLRRRLVLDQRCSPRYIHIHNLKTMLKVFCFCFSYSISLQTFGNFILHFKALTGRFVVISLIKNCPVTSWHANSEFHRKLRGLFETPSFGVNFKFWCLTSSFFRRSEKPGIFLSRCTLNKRVIPKPPCTSINYIALVCSMPWSVWRNV